MRSSKEEREGPFNSNKISSGLGTEQRTLSVQPPRKPKSYIPTDDFVKIYTKNLPETKDITYFFIKESVKEDNKTLFAVIKN